MRPSFRIASIGAVVALAAVVAACGGPATPAATPPGAPTVVTGNWALGAVAAGVAGGQARVLDVVPAGTDPAAPLTAAEIAEVRRADVVVEVGDGAQPFFEQAAAGAARVVRLASSPADAARGPWLDPARLDAFAADLAAELRRVDPGRAQTWSDGATDTAAEDSSLDADLHSTLSTCPRTTIVTATPVWSDLASANGLVDRTGAAHPAGAAVLAQSWGSTPAGAGHRSLDTLVGQPAGGYPRAATYADELEQDLGVLSSALSCPQEDQ